MKPKALNMLGLPEATRQDPAELTAMLRPVAATLPSAMPPPAPVRDDLPTSFHIGFRASPAMAKLLHQLSEPHGGMRRWIAKTLIDMGHEVGPEDLVPAKTKRSYDY